MELAKNQQRVVTIEGYSGEGAGVARIDGRVVFVQGALRGEVCRILIVKVLKNLAFGKVLAVLERSKMRTESDCPNFPRCGGCTYRHMDYAEELSLKRERVQENLRRIGGSDVAVEEILGGAVTDGYRNKAQFPVSADGAVGFYRARTHEVIEAEDCRLCRAEANAAAKALRVYMAKSGASGYDERSGKGLVRHLYVRSNRKGECLVCIVVNGKKLPKEQLYVDTVREYCPSAIGVVLCVNEKRSNVILGEQYRTLWGEDRLEDTLCGHTFRLSVPSFYQVNRDQAQRLYEKAMDYAALTGEETVLDLYCGVGTITLTAAEKAKRVIGAEIVPEAIEDAKENAERNGIENAEFFCGDAGEVAAKLADEKLRPDVVIVDPPRKGLLPGVAQTVASMQPTRIVYVSCDSATLARDVKEFSSLGYRAARACAVDMFPRADHVEAIVQLVRE